MTKSYNNNKLTVVSVEVGLVCSARRVSFLKMSRNIAKASSLPGEIVAIC